MTDTSTQSDVQALTVRLQDLEAAIAGAINAISSTSSSGQGAALTADQVSALSTVSALLTATGGDLEAVINEAIVYSPMTLTDAQKAQVRTNIDVLSSGEVAAAIKDAIANVPTEGGVVMIPDYDHATNFVQSLASADLQHAALLSVQNLRASRSTVNSSASVNTASGSPSVSTTTSTSSSGADNTSSDAVAPSSVTPQQAQQAQPALKLATP